MDNNNMKTFTIVDTESQKTKEIQSNATTVAELKRDLRQHGFNVDGKTIQEGLTRIEFKDDSSLLPHDVPCKGGGITNDLVFRLTKTNKNVASGMDRKEAYAAIKKLNLGEAVKAEFGRNFTQCSTNDLVVFVQNHQGSSQPAKPAEKPMEKPAEKPAFKDACHCESMIKKLCDVLVKNGTIDEEEYKFILGDEVSTKTATSDKSSIYSQEEIKAMFGGM
jgi:hypothetical protein